MNYLAMLAAAEKFLAQHLRGRWQETMSPVVACRRPEIMRNPKTVAPAAKLETK